MESTSAQQRTSENETTIGSTTARSVNLHQVSVADLNLFAAELPNLSARELSLLIQVDLASRWKRGDQKYSEDYFQRFPQVAVDPELTLDIVYCEFLACERSGGSPELDKYLQRFPALSVVLAEQVQLHRALASLEHNRGSVDGEHTEAGTVRPMDHSPSSEPYYDILDQIGSGGMGVVYRARQTTLNRDVALKMLRSIDAGNPQLLARFRSEARVVASLHHPQIVQVFDYGEHEGLPYLAMELIPGGSLADLLNGTPWSPRASARLLAKLAGAVQFAHEHQVIHRDLKPANVLISATEPELEIKIADFGLAKCFIEDSPLRTDSLAFLGTPSYMAPEQARGGTRNTGAAADIYSLGAILYELLTGRPPLCGDSPGETLRLLLSTEPISVRQLAPQVPRDLATICDKCLQGSAERRYVSASALRDDLERLLAGKPIQARPIGEIERAWRWCGRNPLLAGALGIIVSLLVGISTVSLWYSAQLKSELTKSRKMEVSEREATRQAQLRLWDALLYKAGGINGSRRRGQRFDSLTAIATASELQLGPEDGTDRQLQLRNAVIAAVAQTDLRTVRTIQNWPVSVQDGALSVAADLCVAATDKGVASGFRLSDGELLWTIPDQQPDVTPRLSRDGRLLALIDQNSTAVWRIHTEQPEQVWRVPQAKRLGFAPNGKHVAYSVDTEMFLARLSDGMIVRSLGPGTAVSRFVFDESSTRVAICTEREILIISTESGKIETRLPPAQNISPILAWHPSGDYLAVWQTGNSVILWDSRTGNKAHSFSLAGMAGQLCFSRDGSILAAQTLWSQRLWVWNVDTGETCLEVPEFACLASEPGVDSKIHFLSQADGAGVAIELSGGACRALARALDVPLGSMMTHSISPDGRLIAFSGSLGIEIWDLQTRRRLAQSEIGFCSAFFNSNGDLIVGTETGIYQLPRRIEPSVNPPVAASDSADRAPTQSLLKFGPPTQLHGPIDAFSLAVSANAGTMIFREAAGWSLRESNCGKVLTLQTSGDPRCGDISNDNLFAAIANWNHPGATVWDAVTGERKTTLDIGRYGELKFSPDGRYLATTPDGVALWSTHDWQRIHQWKLNGTTPSGLNIAFSPDSHVLAVMQSNGILELMDTQSKQRLASLTGPQTGGFNMLTFSPDQRWLIAATSELESQMWDLTALRRDLALRNLDWPAEVLQPLTLGTSPSGRLSVSLDWGDMKW